MSRTAADEVLSRYWDEGSVPVDPARIAVQMGVAVMADPRLQGSGHYYPGDTQNGPRITYNPNENIVRQRFTIAHELGHHVLKHGERDRDTPAQFTMSSHDQKELDANSFAARLLMPAKFVNAAISVARIRTVEDLARTFRVSTAAMKFRLKEMGYRV